MVQSNLWQYSLKIIPHNEASVVLQDNLQVFQDSNFLFRLTPSFCFLQKVTIYDHYKKFNKN